MKKLLMAAVATFTLTLATSAIAYEVLDPKNILDQTDKFLNMGSIHQAIQMDDTAFYIEMMSSSTSDDSSSDIPSDSKSDMAIAKDISVRAFTPDWVILKGEEAIRISDYDAANGNKLRYLLSSPTKMIKVMDQKGLSNDEGKIELISVSYTDYKTWTGQTIQAVKVLAKSTSIWDGQTFEFYSTISLGKDVSFIAQVLEIEFMDENGTFVPFRQLEDTNR